MKTQSGIRRAVAAAFLAGSFVFGAAWAGPMDTAQSMSLTGSDDTVTGTVTATIVGGNVAVYSFWANPSDVITVDIDTDSSIDTIASVHSPAPAYTVERVQDDSSAFPFDPGSVSPLDPLITDWIPADSGIHYVAVSLSPDRVADGGTFLALGGSGSGTFTLNITCTRASTDPAAPPACAQGSTTTSSNDTSTADTPPPPVEETPPPPPVATSDVQRVRIDIRPGARSLVRVNPSWKELIPVAIFSSRDFDVRNVNKSSLTFGRTGDEQSLRNCNRHYTRWHRHHRYALVCYFENSQSGFEVGDEEGVLKGALANGTAFEGRAMLRVVPEKRHYGHDLGRGHDYDRRADNDDHRRGRR
jgi:hypothetical protein